MEEYRQLNQLIEYATSEDMQKPDQKAFYDVADVIRSRADMPKEAVRAFLKRIQKKHTHVLMLTLELLEFSTFACEINLHNQFATKDFLLRIGALLNSKDVEEIVKSRVLMLIQTWHSVFQRDLQPLFFNFYDNVRQKGLEIPTTYESPYKKVQKRDVPPAQPASSNTYSNAVPQISPERRPVNTSARQTVAVPPLSAKMQKLKGDLDIMKNNLGLANELIDGHPVGQPVATNDTLVDLITTLQSSVDQLQNLITQLDDEFMLQYTLNLNDDLLKTIERYTYLKKGQRPPSLRNDQVEEDVLRQIKELEIKEKEKKLEFNAPAVKKQLVNDFKVPQTWQQAQPQATQAPAPVPKPQENLIDLFDDPQPQPAVNQGVQNNGGQQQNNQNNGLPIDIFNAVPPPPPPVQVTKPPVPGPQQNVDPTLNIQNLYNQQQQQQQPVNAVTQSVAPNAQANRYSALEALSNPLASVYGPGGAYYQQPGVPIYPGAYPPVYAQPPPPANTGSIYGGYAGVGVGVPPQANYQGGLLPNATIPGATMVQSVYQQPPNLSGFNNYGASTQQKVPVSYNMPQASPEKKPFDDLDDMFGIDTSSAVTKNNSNKAPVKAQAPVQQNQAVNQNYSAPIEDLF